MKPAPPATKTRLDISVSSSHVSKIRATLALRRSCDLPSKSSDSEIRLSTLYHNFDVTFTAQVCIEVRHFRFPFVLSGRLPLTSRLRWRKSARYSGESATCSAFR